MSSRFSTIDEAVEAIRGGRVVIVVDAEDRENEGDFVCAAEKASTETVNFMITYGRGQLCMPILPEVSQRLSLHPMVEANTAPLGTNYTVPVDHRSTRTGNHRGRTLENDPLDLRSDERAGRLQPARPPLSARGQGRRRAAPRGTHRGGRRPGTDGRA